MITMLADLLTLATALGETLTVAIEQGPEPEDVKAGWVAFAMFGLGILAIAVLGVFLTRSLKNVDRAASEGRYDDSESKPRRSAAHADDRG